ncbi:HNH endonuclease [uncultured Bradyrhizobium sp.]|uniref:HNH endonuclease n=1 Tax=uncultured Bradyrhizobium sp. TaxID=199684 RepID=UPI0035CC27FA
MKARGVLPYATIIVGARTQYVCKVSWQDLDFLMQWPWTYAVSHPRHGGLVYARRSVCDGGRNVTILMHRVIIAERMGLPRPSEKHFVDHENGDSLDNRRENDQGLQQLRWLTNKENAANRRGIRSVPAVAVFRSQLSDIPF